MGLRLLLWCLALASLALNAFLVVRRGPSLVPATVGTSESAAAPAGARTEVSAPAAQARPPNDLTSCLGRLATLETVAVERSGELRRVLPLAQLFRLGERNPEAEMRLGPLIDALLAIDGGSGPSRTLECRDVVCKLTLLEPTGSDANVWGRALQRRNTPLRAHTSGMSFHVGNPTQDPVTREGLVESAVYFKLAGTADPRGSGAPARDGG
jgi:hypothetical protein